MTDNRLDIFIRLRLIAILLIGLGVAYILTGFLGINRLAWVAAHQGRYYTAYWLSNATVSLLLFVPLFAYIRRGFAQATGIGIAVGYLASCAAGMMMYFQRGIGGPATTLRHEAATYGLASLVVTHFIVVLIVGGPIYGCVASIITFAIGTRNIRILIILLAAVALIAGTVMIVSSSNGCCRQIQFLP